VVINAFSKLKKSTDKANSQYEMHFLIRRNQGSTGKANSQYAVDGTGCGSFQ